MAYSAEKLENRETSRLIGSDKVEGTNVYRSDGDKTGKIERVMIDKLSGKVAYAVMSFGGFMGFGDDHYPLPWSKLTYNERLDGYEVNVTEDELRNAPKHAAAERDLYDPEWERRVHEHYGVPGYWS